jgi:hypothetical protein
VSTTAGDVLLEQARSQLARQEAAVDTVRTRATAVFSASGVVAALFATRVLNVAHPSNWAYVAVALLVCGAIATGYVLAPRNMAYTEKLDDWFSWLEESRNASDRDDALAIGLANNLAYLWNQNRDTIEWLAWGYLSLCVLFALQVAVWAIAAILR